MKYTRQHYINIANLVARLHQEATDAADLFMLETIDTLIERLVARFMRDNSRFSPVLFTKACKGVKHS